MGALMFKARDTIEETIDELDQLYKSLRYQESQESTANTGSIADWIKVATQIIQQQNDRLVELVNALASSSIEKAHRLIININTSLPEFKDKKDELNNRLFAIKSLQDAIEKVTGKPYEADKKLVRRIQLEKRLAYIEQELPYLSRKRNSVYAPPETEYYFERFSYEKSKILEELKTL